MTVKNYLILRHAKYITYMQIYAAFCLAIMASGINQVKLKNIVEFKTPLPIAKIINELNFITKKRYVGLYLRRSAIKIPENDFKTVISKNELS